MSQARSLAVRELLTLRIGLLDGLPVPFSASMVQRGESFLVTTSRAAYAAAGARGEAAFVRREVADIAQAVALGRVYPSHLAKWIKNKRARRGWLVSPEAAGSDIPASAYPSGDELSFGEVFDALDAELVEVEV